ncbi:MAG: hypothetical protein HYW45_03910 [Candidatus Daviesbacteria bacterium]|nr:MAG: hypothetical protein HYW45_03910 [Candidatus Daviesbacteria bacterium]
MFISKLNLKEPGATYLPIFNANALFKKILIAALIIAILGGAGYLVSRFYDTGSQNASPSSSSVKSQRISLSESFEIPTGLEGKDAGAPLKVSFQRAQLANRIFISGKPVMAKDGTKFLMLNFLLENSNSKALNVKTTDLIRLIDQNGKKFAPSYFNKGKPLAADSTKKDTLGFLVPDNIKEFKIQYGTIDGPKKLLELKFN